VLAASFFFARGDVERNSCRHLFPTIAYQLTTSIPSLRVPIYQTLHDDHGILEHGIQDQLQKLIVEPLLDKNFSPCTSARVVIIDAIDECDDQKSAKDIIKFFASALRHELNNLPLQFIITSRPEIHIRAAFRDPCIRSMTHIVNLWDFNSHADIHVFLTSHFEQIYQDHFDIIISKPTNISLALIRAPVSSYEGKKPKSNEGKKLGYAFWKVLTNCWLTKGEETERL